MAPARSGRTGNAQPRPRNALLASPSRIRDRQPYQSPISTLSAPLLAIAPQPATSPTRNAGFPLIRTVSLPFAIGEGGCDGGGGKPQACRAPTTAAGRPAIRTVGTPGPPTVPGGRSSSPIRKAAGTMPIPLVDMHEHALDHAVARRLERGAGRALYRHVGPVDRDVRRFQRYADRPFDCDVAQTVSSTELRVGGGTVPASSVTASTPASIFCGCCW